MTQRNLLGSGVPAARAAPAARAVNRRPTRAGPAAGPTGATAAVLREAIEADGTNVTSFARRHRIPEGTLRRTLEGRNCVSADRFLEWADRIPSVRERLECRLIVPLRNGFALQ